VPCIIIHVIVIGHRNVTVHVWIEHQLNNVVSV
jgi:hypothetical protein